jgi:hypothetical protein
LGGGGRPPAPARRSRRFEEALRAPGGRDARLHYKPRGYSGRGHDRETAREAAPARRNAESCSSSHASAPGRSGNCGQSHANGEIKHLI